MPDPKEQEIGATQGGGRVSVEVEKIGESAPMAIFNALKNSRTLQTCFAVAGSAGIDAILNGFNWRQALLAAVAATFAALRVITNTPVGTPAEKK